MMCKCDEDFARRFLPHQINNAVDKDTQLRIPINLGFQEEICNVCRNISEEAHPKAEIYGSTSKVKRYYWREIAIETIRRFGEWAIKQGYNDWLMVRHQYKEEYDEIERVVIDEIQELHQKKPKYTYSEESQNEVLTKYKVEVISITGTCLKSELRKAILIENEVKFSVEEYAAKYFIQNGYQVLVTESIPFHVLC